MTRDNANAGVPATGAGLDEAVAKAMGYAIHPTSHFGPWMERNDRSYGWLAFSSDPATLDEKLAWLLARPNVVDVDVTASLGRAEAAFYWRHDGVQDAIERSGANIHEATARLVVAVAAARKEPTP